MEQVRAPMLDLALREHFTDEEFEALSVWCENAQCKIDFVQWLDGGWSGAKLAVVLVQDDTGVRKDVLKYCPSRDDQPLRDVLAFTKAAASGPKGFAKAHLVGLDPAAQKPILNGVNGLFLLMEYRTEGYHQYHTMAILLDRQALGIACDTIMVQTLVKWNRPKGMPRRTPDGISAQDFLREMLGRKWQPGGPVRTAVERLEASSSNTYITASGRELPKPLDALISGRGIENVHLFGFRGNAHGDLHVDNILVPILVNRPPSAEDFEKFTLIDLSTFGDSRLIAVDPAYLLLSIIARRLGDLSPQARTRLAKLVLDPKHGESGGVPAELAAAVHAMHTAGIKLTEPRSLYDEWHMESLVAIIGCALTITGWDLNDDDRRWFLQLSGMAIDLLGNMSLSLGSRAAPNDAVSKGNKLPHKRSSSRERGSARDDPGKGPPETSPATDRHKENVIAIREGITMPGEDPGNMQNTTALEDKQVVDDPAVLDEQVVNQQGKSCTELTNELALEIPGLRDNLSAAQGHTATTTARAVIEELTAELEEMRKWHAGGQSERQIAHITTIGTARTRLNAVRDLLRSISTYGTTATVLDDLASAVERLQGAAQAIIQIDKPRQPPDP